MFPTLATSLSLLLAALLLPSPAASQTLWESPVDFSSSNQWPPEPCVRSCLTGAQCAPCGGYSLSAWVGCTNNGCFCSRYETAYFYLFECIAANCCLGCVSTEPYSLIYGYCAATAAKVAAGGNGGATVTTFTAPPSVTPTDKPVSNPYGAEASGPPPNPTTPATTPQAPADPGLTRSDKIALGVGLGVGIPSVIAAVIVMIQFCRGG